MSEIYERWDRLVGAVLRRETDREIALRLSFSSSSSTDLSSRSSFDSTFFFNPFFGDVHAPAEVEIHHFVGMQKDIEEIVSMVKDETSTQRVVKIYGMGGLGKTTLARKVYNHIDVQSYTRAWVCVTQQFQPKAIFRDILKQLDGNNAEIDRMDDNDLVRGIQDFLMQRKCLIVIDDIWEDDHWDIIKKAFPIDNRNLLLTTRNENIATQDSKPHKLELLSQDEGWDLLQKIALPQNCGSDIQLLEAIGREIVEQCGRLPLAISVIGGILRHKEDRLAEWKKVSMKIDTYLRHGEGVEGDERVKQVLDLSYDALPYYLKPCFLYLACFSEDNDIRTERLYRLWMAEGLICHQDKGRDETLRDVAERYLTELAMRCMVQVHKDEYRYTSHKFDSCRLHDLMHDLCSSKAETEKLVKRIDPSRYHNDIPPSVSRLVITFDENMVVAGMAGLQELSRLRSFMVHTQKYWTTESIRFEDSKISFDKSECLRILVLNGCDFERDELRNKLLKLIHLRYLSLMGSKVRELPEFVCGMPYLQTLDLNVHQYIIRVPNVICKMKRLRHLFLPYGKMEVLGGNKLRLEGLNELETLHGIDSQTACIADIPKLMSLVELKICVNNDMDSMKTLADHMSNKECRLREAHVKVHSCDFSSENGRDVLKNLLMSPSLVSLSFRECKMSGDFPEYEEGMSENLLSLELYEYDVGRGLMEKLGKYPMLQKLTLSEVEMGMEEAIIFPSNSFPRLKFLTFDDLPSLKRLQVDERALPKLTTLQIDGCYNLEKLPDGLRFISTLQELDIRGMPDKFKERVRGQDYATISHIPTVKWNKF